ncbi:hypothetical protein GCM10022255_094670 [Dactylosporangium darangshiense]|uniref:S-adenosyl methyltransferase n=2 Tax=Dactylosporangium darangshiense TaxID=579108 RepID=A0ABP8DQ36_9ACTN
MTSTPQGAVAYVDADLRQPRQILTAPALTHTIDLTQPVGLLLIAVLHFLDNTDDPYVVVADLIDALPAGSYVAISHATFDLLETETVQRLAPFTDPGTGHGTFRPRQHHQVARFRCGGTLLDPGLCSTVEWRPDHDPQPEADAAFAMSWAGVARI